MLSVIQISQKIVISFSEDLNTKMGNRDDEYDYLFKGKEPKINFEPT